MKTTALGHAAILFSSAVIALSIVVTGCTDDSPSPSQGPASGAVTPAGGARFFLPTGAEIDNTAAPVVEVDSQGTTHALYPAYAGGGAYYAHCGAGCGGPDTTKVVKLETDGTVANAMLVLDAQDRPRVLLSSFSKLYWASCDGACDERASWTVSMILDHGGDREVSGEALALDPQGRPRFVMHTYRAYVGIGQKTPETLWVACDGACEKPESWSRSVMQAAIFEGSHLRFDERGVAKLATVTEGKAAYLECASGCTTENDWHGIGLGDAFASEYDAVAMKPTIAMALTKAGGPRVVFMAKSAEGKRQIQYIGCDADCAQDHWKGMILSDHEKLAVGLDIALTAEDQPRIAYNLDYNIAVATCEDGHCETGDAPWDLVMIEKSSSIPADQIFLYANCNVGAWFLHSPSIALTPAGDYRVGYQARDISGGWSKQDYTKAGCRAGTDMTWSRLALVSK